MDPFLESKINEIVSERPSYGTRRVTAMIWRSGHSVNRKHVRRHVLAMGLVDSRKKSMRMKSPRAIVISTPNRMWGTYFTKVFIPGEGCVYFTVYIDLC